MGRLKGIEPSNAGTTIRCVNHFATIAIQMVEGDGFEPPNPKERIYSPPRLATSLPLQDMNPIMVEDDGLEPPTPCL